MSTCTKLAISLSTSTATTTTTSTVLGVAMTTAVVEYCDMTYNGGGVTPGNTTMTEAAAWSKKGWKMMRVYLTCRFSSGKELYGPTDWSQCTCPSAK